MWCAGARGAVRGCVSRGLRVCRGVRVDVGVGVGGGVSVRASGCRCGCGSGFVCEFLFCFIVFRLLLF